jgi:hypothetical protein
MELMLDGRRRKERGKVISDSVLSNFSLSLTRLSFWGGAGVSSDWLRGVQRHPGRHWAPSHVKAAAARPLLGKLESSPAVKPGRSQILFSQRHRATNSTAASQHPYPSLEYHTDIIYQPRYKHVCL